MHNISYVSIIEYIYRLYFAKRKETNKEENEEETLLDQSPPVENDWTFASVLSLF